MTVIKDHPRKWCVLSLDGFGSHLCTNTLNVFTENFILVYKKEGDTSSVTQAYNQNVAKQDKTLVRTILDNFWFLVHGKIDHWELIIALNVALNAVKKTSWQKSHICVNTCPSKCAPFGAWVK